MSAKCLFVCLFLCGTDSISRTLKKERADSRSRSPSPPLLADVPPPILQPYDGSLTPSDQNQLRSTPPPIPVPDPAPPKLEELEIVLKDQENNIESNYINSNHNFNPPTPTPNVKANNLVDWAQVKKHNMNLRALAFKEIKKPGRSKYSSKVFIPTPFFSSLISGLFG